MGSPSYSQQIVSILAITGLIPAFAAGSETDWGLDSVSSQTATVDTSKTFSECISHFRKEHLFRFGTAAAGADAIRSTADLQKFFTPYGIAGTTVINHEWQRYQPFNDENFVFDASALALTARIPPGGGLRPGGITSGQIWSRETFVPNSAHEAVAISVRMKIPKGKGAWPAVWLYTKEPKMNDSSEIDNPEFFNETNQSEFDWTGFQHGPGVGRQIYSIMSNKYVWHPGVDFSGDYHDYQTLWTTDAVYKYVDGRLVYAQTFKWTAKGAAQLGVDLAVGTDDVQAFPGLQPTSFEEFPMSLYIQSIEIWSM